MVVYLDLETYCETPIKHGVYRYAQDAEVLLFAYAIDDAPPQVVDVANGEDLPDEVVRAVRGGATLIAHNANFDRVVLEQQSWWPKVSITQWHCTAAQALSHALPAGLASLCGVFGLTGADAKDTDGKRLIRKFCMPQPKNHKVRRWTRSTAPDDWARFVAYALSDIQAMRTLHQRYLPTWSYSGAWLDLWHLDQSMNDRGFGADVQFAERAIEACAEHLKRVNDKTEATTDGAVESVTQRARIVEFVFDRTGHRLASLTPDSIEKFLDTDPPSDVAEVLRARLDAAKSSVAKYKRIVDSHVGGRIRGGLQYRGASRTGRWAGRIFQPQNLPRPALKYDGLIPYFIEECRSGRWHRSPLDEDTLGLASSALRGVIVPSDGNMLVAADLANIEGRVLAWLAREDWKLDAFRAYDAGTGPDLYKLAYSRAFGVPLDEVTKEQRQIGKVAELACGYQGASGAFDSMAAIYGVTLPPEAVSEAVQRWRKAHARIVRMWYDTERAAKQAVLNPGTEYTCGRIVFDVLGPFLRAKLPSGRYLSYARPVVIEDRLTCWGVNQYTRQWDQLDTYGGKLVENMTQSVACDVLSMGLWRAEKAELNPVLTIHDEIICDTAAWDAAARLIHCMTSPITWAGGLPLAAEAMTVDRYRK